jgi:hypothetical protein
MLGTGRLLLSALLPGWFLLSGLLLGAALATLTVLAAPCAAQSAIPPLTELVATPGEPQSVELRWLTPLFEPGGAARDRDCDYEFRYGSTYLTAQNFATSPLLNGSLPSAVWAGLLDIQLDFNVSVSNNGTFPIYTVYWDHAYLRAWLYAGHDSPFIYSSVGAGLPNEKITFTIKKDNDPQWSQTNTVYTDRHGYAEWQTGDICNNVNGEWFTFKAKWDQHAVNLRNGMVVQSTQSAEETQRMILYDDTDVVGAPNNMGSGGGTTTSWCQDSWIYTYIPANGVGEDCTIACEAPPSVPPPVGMLPGVPGAMLAFQINKSTGPELLLPAEVRVQYPASRLMEFGGVAECALEAYRYEEGRGAWVLIPERLGINRADHSITFATAMFGLFAIAGESDADMDGGGNLQELEWGTTPGVADTDQDGVSDGDELWWSGGNPNDPLKVHGADQQGLGEGLVSQPCYWIAGRIVSDRAVSPISTCAYIGPPIDVTYTPDWSGPPLFKSDAAWGDFDGDGDPDLAICGESGGVPITRTYENTGSDLVLRQTLTGVQNEGSGGLTWGDYDADGDLDLAVAGMGATQRFAGIYENDGTGNLALDAAQTLAAVSYASLAWADFDEDLDVDLLLMGHDGTQAVTILYRNDPPGTLTPDTLNTLTGLYAGSADWGDLDNDGDPDLLLTGSDGAQRQTIFYKNHPAGWLTADGSHGLPGVALSDAAWGDIDRDGDVDLAFTGETSSALRCARVYRNDKGTLTQIADVLTIYRSSCALGDVDLDGDMDVAFCGYDGGGLMTYVYENAGAGGFEAFPLEFPGVREGSLQLVDVDLDGDLDFFMTGADWGTGYSLLYRHGGIAAGVEDPGRASGLARVWLATPNPVGGNAALRYRLVNAGRVRLGIYDVAGRCVRMLVEGPVTAGVHDVVWDGRTSEGTDAGAGAFFYRLEEDEHTASGRLVRVR